MDASIQQKLTQYAHQLLAKRDYSVFEFRQKLMQKRLLLLNRANHLKEDSSCDSFYAADWVDNALVIDDGLDAFIDEMIETFIQNRYLSDARYRDQWMELYRSRYGSHRILYELSQKGIDPQLINERLDWLTKTEMAACFLVWQKKFDQLPKTPKENHKQQQFLIQKGFDFDTISSMLKAVKRDEAIEMDGLDEIPID